MKKVILAFDGDHFSNGAMEFARRMNNHSPILLTGIFLPQLTYANLWSYADSSGGAFNIPLIEDSSAELVQENIGKFQDYCRQNEIQYKVHKDYLDFALPELKRETRFADVLILGGETFYRGFSKENRGEYMKEALHSAECPVVIVPEKFEPPKLNIIAVDGSESSLFALKQFSYLFGQFSQNRTLIVTTEDEDEVSKKVMECVNELTRCHFPNFSLVRLTFDPGKYLSTWVEEKKASIFVSGSFGRSFWSRLVKKSFVSELISDLTVPIFIAHR